MEPLRRAQAGDQQAFAQLTDGYRQELQLHCYRILGSTQDAEDALQETLLGAWRALANFEERASIRTWLYRIATNRCLNMLRGASRRPAGASSLHTARPDPTRAVEVTWLEPYPDVLLDGLTDERPGPDARYETRESVSLAFITILQLLPPRQRVALVLRDVLGYRASEAAEMIDATEASVESALKRARMALHDRHADPKDREPPPAPNSVAERKIVARVTAAFETGNADELVALLTKDVSVTMPPIPGECKGPEDADLYFRKTSFRTGRSTRTVPTRANGQPTLATYVRDPQTDLYHASGIAVLTLSGGLISAVTIFGKDVLPSFGLPRVLSSTAS
ncbi:MAG: DNA-directed polymerase sigma-70 factor [Acidimicrobiaceae bacterium]|nr:DNA-directed polymerase sigma-70 factor [Acidimicrobiaceae bacterium]